MLRSRITSQAIMNCLISSRNVMKETRVLPEPHPLTGKDDMAVSGGDGYFSTL